MLLREILKRFFCPKQAHSRWSESVYLKSSSDGQALYFIKYFSWLVVFFIYCSTCYADICDLRDTIVFETVEVRDERELKRNYEVGNSFCSYNGMLAVIPDISVVGTYATILETYCKSSPEVQQNNYILVPENSILYYCQHPRHTKILVTGGDVVIPILMRDMH
jgi:hypothetical protein